MLGLLFSLIIGGLVGWAAQGVMNKNVPGGILGNIIVGFIGSALGGWLFSFLSFGIEIGGFAIIPAVLGAILVVLIYDLIF